MQLILYGLRRRWCNPKPLLRQHKFWHRFRAGGVANVPLLRHSWEVRPVHRPVPAYPHHPTNGETGKLCWLKWVRIVPRVPTTLYAQKWNQLRAQIQHIPQERSHCPVHPQGNQQALSRPTTALAHYLSYDCISLAQSPLPSFRKPSETDNWDLTMYSSLSPSLDSSSSSSHEDQAGAQGLRCF